MIGPVYILLVFVLSYSIFCSCRDSDPDQSGSVTPRGRCKVFDYMRDGNALINVYHNFDSTPGFEYEEHNLFASNFLFENLFQSGLKLKINK